MSRTQSRFWLILLLTILSLVISLPQKINLNPHLFGHSFNVHLVRPDLKLSLGSYNLSRSLDIKLGLDLAGGTRVTLDADMSSIAPENQADALDSAKEIIAQRVDLFGISEPNIYSQQAGSAYQIIVELPGLDDPQAALELIGTTAQLEFLTPIYDQTSTESAQPELVDFQPSTLTGADLQKTTVDFDPNTGQPVISLQFSPSGTEKFAQLTKEYLGKPLAIALDRQPLTAPVVQSEITTGQAVISGDFTLEDAQLLSKQLNAGALPVPIKITSQNTITATLGADSINQSVRAGLIGLSVVILFMIAYYGQLGLIASVGLLIYGLITLSLYKLIPITLTLPGIAGFILSVGMAVDSNILIFERMKEEIRAGRAWPVALELGFGRAWDSIKDANIATLIIAFILFNPLNWSFLPTSGPIRGFAVTLALGILISLFTGIFVTRTLLRLFYHGPRSIKLFSSQS